MFDTPPNHVEVRMSSKGVSGEPDSEGVSYHVRNKEDGDQGEDTDSHHITGRLDNLTEFINLHVRYYRLIPSVAGTFFVIFLLRYFRVPLRRIRQVSDISQVLITGNRKLSGIVQITGHDSLGVWHVPTWKWMLSVGTYPSKKWSSKDLLKVHFSGVAITDYSVAAAWLREHVQGKRVWLRLLDRTYEDIVYCVVYSRSPRLLWKMCVNKELLELGVASFEEVRGVGSNADYVKLTNALLESERRAKQKGKGMWRGTEYVTLWNRLKNYLSRK